MSKTIYFGSGWFNEDQLAAYNDAYMALEQNPTVDMYNSYIPREHQYHDLEVADHPELLHDREWSTGTFRGDINGIKTSDVTVAIYLPFDEDPGLAMEIGYAHAIGKHVLMVGVGQITLLRCPNCPITTLTDQPSTFTKAACTNERGSFTTVGYDGFGCDK